MTATVVTTSAALSKKKKKAPVDIEKQWQEARARRMQFEVGDYKDSNIRMLTAPSKRIGYSWCWTVSCCPSYIETRCHCRGVKKQRSRTPWALTAEKLQLSVFFSQDVKVRSSRCRSP